MKGQFNLKNFLIENKLTHLSQLNEDEVPREVRDAYNRYGKLPSGYKLVFDELKLFPIEDQIKEYYTKIANDPKVLQDFQEKFIDGGEGVNTYLDMFFKNDTQSNIQKRIDHYLKKYDSDFKNNDKFKVNIFDPLTIDKTIIDVDILNGVAMEIGVKLRCKFKNTQFTIKKEEDKSLFFKKHIYDMPYEKIDFSDEKESEYITVDFDNAVFYSLDYGDNKLNISQWNRIGNQSGEHFRERFETNSSRKFEYNFDHDPSLVDKIDNTIKIVKK